MMLMERVQRAGRKLCNRFRSTCCILLYHRVVELEMDPQDLCVSPERFDQHLGVLKSHYNVLRLDELRDHLKKADVPNNCVCITFDDGYYDNLEFAQPLLEQHQLPATVFVTSESIGSDQEFWWDELDRILLHTAELPQSCSIHTGARQFEWCLKECQETATIRNRIDFAWNVSSRNDPTVRHQMYREICLLLRDSNKQVRDDILAQLRTWSGSSPTGRTTHRTMTADELKALSASPQIEIGGHTRFHCQLSLLDADSQLEDIRGCKASLESIVRSPITMFSYPFGFRGSYNDQTIEILKSTSIDLACSNFPCGVRAGTDPYQLPRFLVRNWDRSTFMKNVARSFSH